MTELLTKVWTYEDYLNLPDDGNRYEILKGELYVTPSPGTAHQFTSGQLNFRLYGFVLEHDLGEVYHAPYDVRLSPDADPVQPDILVIAKNNVPQVNDRYFTGVPDLIVEIFSKSTARTDTNIKFSVYEQAGVPEYWIVDPKTQTVRIYTLENGVYEEWGAYAREEIITSKVLDGLEIINSSLFKA